MGAVVKGPEFQVPAVTSNTTYDNNAINRPEAMPFQQQINHSPQDGIGMLALHNLMTATWMVVLTPEQ